MKSLILAAGNGDRFTAVGYRWPKPLLPMPDGRPLIAWSTDRLPPSDWIAVVRAGDVARLRPWLGDSWLVALDQVTSGPLASAYAARKWLAGELLIVYCDVVLDCAAFVAAARASGAPHACVTFTSNDPRYGYWDGAGVVEKQVVSDQAVSGAFYFRDAADFVRRAADMPLGAGIPSLLNAATYCHHADVIDVGTPADYEAFMRTEALV